jgi:hypothetical protein
MPLIIALQVCGVQKKFSQKLQLERPFKGTSKLKAFLMLKL